MKKIYLGFLRTPLFWTAILFGAGIALSAKFPLRTIYLVFFFGFISFAILLRVISLRKKILSLQLWAFISLLFALICFSAFYYQFRIPAKCSGFLGKIEPDQQVWIRAKTKGLSRDYEKYSRVLCDLVWLDSGKGRQKIPLRFWLNYYEEEKLYPGEEFLALVRIRPLKRFKNPGVPDPGARFSKSGIYFSMSQIPQVPILKIYHRGLNPLAWLDQYREFLKEEIKRSGANSNYLLLALLLGDESEIPEPVMRCFRDSGTAHILVVSGLNLSLVATFCFLGFLIFFRIQPWFLNRIDPYPLAGILSVIPTSFYAVISGMAIPVIRAYIMVLVLLIAISLRKIRDLLNTLGLAGLLLFLLNPSALFDPSFQLSFLAVAVLIIYFPSLWQAAGGNWFRQETFLLKQESHFFRSLLRLVPLKILEYIYGLFLATTLIQIFLAPIIAYYFSRLNLSGLIANLPIVPLCGFWTLPLGLMGLFLSLPFPNLGSWFLNLAGVGAKAMERSVEFFASMPYASILVRPPTTLELTGWFLLLLSLFGLVKFFAERKNVRLKGILAFLPSLSLILLGVLLAMSLNLAGYLKIKKSRPAPDELRVSLLDVGLGQSVLIDLPGRKRILLDGGGSLGAINLGEAVVARYLLNQGIRQLEVVALSHPQEDHGAGLEYILREFPVQEFWLNGKSNPLSQKLLELATQRKVKIRFLNSDSPPETIGGATFEFFNPAPHDLSRLSLNDSSLVIKMTYGSTSFLFPGEVSASIEKKLIAKYDGKLQSQILIAPHHGSNTSSSLEFLQAVNPQFILISCAQSAGLKFPSPEALNRMQKNNAQILRTDQQGTIIISLQKQKLKVLSY